MHNYKRLDLLFAALLLVLVGCGKDIDEPLDVDVVFEAVHYHPGGYSEGRSRVLTMEYTRLGQSGEPAGSLASYVIRGRLRVDRVDWIKKSCGPTAYWDYRGEEAYAHTVGFLQGLPLTSTSDADALLEEALPWVAIGNPGDEFPKPDPNGPSYEHWEVMIAPLRGLLETALVDAGKEGTLAALNHTSQNDDGFPLVFAVEDLDASGTTVEVLDYVSEFNDRMLREYLQEKRPSCLLD